MTQKWWVPNGDERPCPAQCDPAFAIDSDKHWRCGCGCWEIVDTPQVAQSGNTWEELCTARAEPLWGDIWLDEEARMTTAEERARQSADLADRLARGAALDEIAKAKSLVCGRDGKIRVPLKMRRCRDATAAACIDKKGRRWEAGCELHRNGCCEFVHPDQPEWAQLVQGQAAGVDRFAALKSKPKAQTSRW